MAKSADSVQALIVELEEFLKVTLQKEHLSTTAKEHRQRIIEKITSFKQKERPSDESEPDPRLAEKIKSSKQKKKPSEEIESDERISAKIESFKQKENLSQKCEIDQRTDFQKTFEAMKRKSQAQSVKETIRDEKGGEIISNIAAKDITNPHICGYLSELSNSKTETLSRRPRIKLWCLIKQGIFYIFDYKKDFCQRHAFYLTGYGFHKEPGLITDPDLKPLAFELRAQGRKTYSFIAESPREFSGWRDVVEVSKKTDTIGIVEVVYETPICKVNPVKKEKERDDGKNYYLDQDFVAKSVGKIQSSSPKVYDDDDDCYDKLLASVDHQYMGMTSQPSRDNTSDNGIPQEQSPALPPARPDKKTKSVNIASKKTGGSILKLFKSKKSLSLPAKDCGDMFVATKSYTAKQEIELSFEEGDEIKLMWKDSNNETWFGMLNGKVGMINKKYMSATYEEIDESDVS